MLCQRLPGTRQASLQLCHKEQGAPPGCDRCGKFPQVRRRGGTLHCPFCPQALRVRSRRLAGRGQVSVWERTGRGLQPRFSSQTPHPRICEGQAQRKTPSAPDFLEKTRQAICTM